SLLHRVGLAGCNALHAHDLVKELAARLEHETGFDDLLPVLRPDLVLVAARRVQEDPLVQHDLLLGIVRCGARDPDPEVLVAVALLLRVLLVVAALRNDLDAEAGKARLLERHLEARRAEPLLRLDRIGDVVVVLGQVDPLLGAHCVLSPMLCCSFGTSRGTCYSTKSILTMSLSSVSSSGSMAIATSGGCRTGNGGVFLSL